jgi:hypothetical protein
VSVDQGTWTDLGAVWDGYQKTVDRWLAAASSGEGAEEVDRLLHEVLHAHGDWNTLLGRVIGATHHH